MGEQNGSPNEGNILVDWKGGKVAAFDLEVADAIPEGGDAFSGDPLRISCAALMGVGAEGGNLLSRTWHGFAEGAEVPYPEAMTQVECNELANSLLAASRRGFEIVTWNGAGFDFRILAQQCSLELRPAIERLALEHIDVAFQLVADKGFMCSLQNASIGMGLEGKMAGVSGAEAPEMWRAGRRAQDAVLQYLEQDAQATLELYLAIALNRFMRWQKSRGGLGTWVPDMVGQARLLRVYEAMELPVVERRPGSSFKPWKRGRFVAWLAEAAEWRRDGLTLDDLEPLVGDR